MPATSTQPIIDRVIPTLGKGIIFWCHTSTPAIHVRSEYVDRSLPPAFILPQGTVSNTWMHYGGLDSFAIIFKPGKMRKLFRQPWYEAKNGVIPLEDAGEPALLELRERVQLAANFEARSKLADDFLLTRLRSADTSHDVVDFSLELFHADLSRNFADVARRTNYSPRHLRRIFTREMGISPKAYHQVKRITYVLANMYQGQYRSLTELAYAAGYSDQAHLTRDFKKFMGVSPRRFLQDQRKSANSKLSHWAEEDA
jgi:AraC-like DNA-binding protein